MTRGEHEGTARRAARFDLRDFRSAPFWHAAIPPPVTCSQAYPAINIRGQAACAKACDERETRMGYSRTGSGGGRHCAMVPWHGACRLDERGCWPGSCVRRVFRAFAFRARRRRPPCWSRRNRRRLASILAGSRARHERSCGRRVLSIGGGEEFKRLPDEIEPRADLKRNARRFPEVDRSNKGDPLAGLRPAFDTRLRDSQGLANFRADDLIFHHDETRPAGRLRGSGRTKHPAPTASPPSSRGPLATVRKRRIPAPRRRRARTGPR